MKVEITKAQIAAIAGAANDLSAMIGAGEQDDAWKKYVKLIDRFLKKNGYKRKYT